jgi:hypothetical protein
LGKERIMSYIADVYKVMIASPSDILLERRIVKDVLSEWNIINSEKRGMVVLPIGWETHSSPSMEDHPQAIINKEILKNADILLGIFWTRLGTPTDKYPSGTVEEIEEHINTKKPTMLYFSSAPVRPDSVDPDQYSKLVEFRLSCQKRGIYETYIDAADFKGKFYRQIQLELNKELYQSQKKVEPDLIEHISKQIPPISNEAKELLINASKDTSGHIMHINYLSGPNISTNGITFLDNDNDPRKLALWESAITELENNGLIEALSYKREIFRVTREGYELVDIITT